MQLFFLSLTVFENKVPLICNILILTTASVNLDLCLISPTPLFYDALYKGHSTFWVSTIHLKGIYASLQNITILVRMGEVFTT